MASRAAQMLIDNDDDEPGMARVGAGEPTNLRPSTVDVTPAPNAPEEFEIVDADDNLQPVQPEPPQQAAEPQQQDEPHQDEPEPQTRPWKRQTRSEKNARARDARDRTFAEINYLREHVQSLEGRLSTYEPRFDEIASARVQEQIAHLDREIQDTTARATGARNRIAQAMMSQDSDALTSALEERDAAIIHGQQLAVRKNVLASGNPLGRDGGQVAPPQRAPQPPPQQTAPPARPLSREAADMAARFSDDHDWIDMRSQTPDGRIRDKDSRVLAFVDADVTADGYDPATPEYWDELVARAAEVLPHRFVQPVSQPRAPAQRQVQQQVPPQRRGPMTAGGADRPPAPGRNQVYLNGDRKQALILAGALDSDGRTVMDRGKFSRLLRSYQEFDRANGVARQ